MPFCDGYTTVGSLGPYRRDLSHFFGRIGKLAHAVAGSPEVSILVNGKRTRVSADIGKQGTHLSFEAQS